MVQQAKPQLAFAGHSVWQVKFEEYGLQQCPACLKRCASQHNDVELLLALCRQHLQEQRFARARATDYEARAIAAIDRAAHAAAGILNRRRREIATHLRAGRKGASAPLEQPLQIRSGRRGGHDQAVREKYAENMGAIALHRQLRETGFRQSGKK
jgi:hypothetical protein